MQLYDSDKLEAYNKLFDAKDPNDIREHAFFLGYNDLPKMINILTRFCESETSYSYTPEQLASRKSDIIESAKKNKVEECFNIGENVISLIPETLTSGVVCYLVYMTLEDGGIFFKEYSLHSLFKAIYG